MEIDVESTQNADNLAPVLILVCAENEKIGPGHTSAVGPESS